MQFLHLEDSPSDAELMEHHLRREWPGCSIRNVGTAAEYRSALEAGKFDLILSDYTLPGFDGLAALALARKFAPGTPFLFLSGTIGEERAVEALKRGAADYVIKDRPTRLIPAIRQTLALAREARERQAAEERSSEHEERFRQVAENVADMIALVALDGRRIYANPAHRPILGDPASLVGSDAFAEIHPDDRPRVRAAFDDTVRTGVGFSLEYRLLLPDRTARRIESQGSVVRDAAGRVTSVTIVSRDITERRDAEARLREQASLLDKARDAIVATDLEHRIAYWNASAERLYGWKADEVYGRRLEELALGFEPARFAAARTQLLATGEWRGGFRLRKKSGETVLVESTWSLVVENDGRPRSILFIDTDVTERRQLETQLLRAQRLESIGTLAGGVAHDLNNVLTPIVLSMELLAERLSAPEERALLEKTRASASHGAALVRQLLAFARGTEAQRTRVRPAEALHDLHGLIQQSLPPSVSLHVRADPPLGAIEADATQFNQVVLNLCLNARDAMPDGGRLEVSATSVTVDDALARANPGAALGPYVRISVADTGAGIAPEIADRIFDPFFTTKPLGKGTGLGLSMVAGIMKNHGGFVQLESEPGPGAAFHLFFPAVEEKPADAQLEPAPPPAGGEGETILLIDDEPVVRTALQMLLQRAGYRVIVAADGQEALREFERQRAQITLAISDMMLPDISGLEVVRELRRRAPALPVIGISGMMASGAFDELLTYEPRIPCLAKPVMPAVLLDAVRCALSVSR
jgi:PAS domain S-box-containing protein